MVDKERITVKKAVNMAFAQIRLNQDFTGLEFKRLCVRIAPKLREKYVETFLRLLRYEHRDEFICINRHNSKFKRVKVANE